jgi:hypothetical protein
MSRSIYSQVLSVNGSPRTDALGQFFSKPTLHLFIVNIHFRLFPWPISATFLWIEAENKFSYSFYCSVPVHRPQAIIFCFSLDRFSEKSAIFIANGMGAYLNFLLICRCNLGFIRISIPNRHLRINATMSKSKFVYWFTFLVVHIEFQVFELCYWARSVWILSIWIALLPMVPIISFVIPSSP